MVVVSACLIGLCTRYDATSAPDEAAVRILAEGKAIPVCPEQLAGLPTPRPRITLVHGDGKDLVLGRGQIITEDGRDITGNLMEACRQIVELAKLSGATTALLKDASPSCGVAQTTIDWARRPGPGILTAVLAGAGIDVKGV